MACVSYELRLRPNKKQQRRLCETLDICMNLWNLLMARAIGIFMETNKVPSVFDLNKEITRMKEEHPEFGRVHSRTLQNVSRRVNRSLTDSLKKTGKNGEPMLPRMRTPDRYRSFEYSCFKDFSIEGKELFLGVMKKDVGGIRFKSNQKMLGDIRTCVIIRKKNHWYARIVCEYEDRGTFWFEPRYDVGIDLGLKNRATLSNGAVYQHDRYEDLTDEIKRIQKKMSDLEPGSARFEKLKRKIQNIHQRIANLRQNEIRCDAKEIAEKHDLIAMEDIDIPKLVQKEPGKGIRRSQYSASWGIFTKALQSAAEAAGSVLVKVDPRGTSQMCSGCGRIVAKDLSVRTHECPYCGLVMDRDVNAARNILAAGRAARPQSRETRG